MVTLKYMSLTQEETNESIATSFTYQGSKEEMDELQNELFIGAEYYIDDARRFGGRIKRLYRHQIEGHLWGMEVRCELNPHGNSISPPEHTYGKRSATLDGGLLSLPLEKHPDYRTRWKYYLATCQSDSQVPAWWSTATTTIVPDLNFRWVETKSELPFGPDSSGKSWRILKEPEMLGTINYELATYTVTETIKCRNQEYAGSLIVNKLNKIVSPENDFGLTGNGNWKCDKVSVFWNGKAWVAQLVYTRSGNDLGWDRRLYAVGGN